MSQINRLENRNKEIEGLKKVIVDQSPVIDASINAQESKILVFGDLRDQMPLLEISRISGISLSGIITMSEVGIF